MPHRRNTYLEHYLMFPRIIESGTVLQGLLLATFANASQQNFSNKPALAPTFLPRMAVLVGGECIL